MNLGRSFQMADKPPTFFSDGTRFSHYGDTQLTENDVSNKDKT